MADQKTNPTDLSAAAYFDAIDDPARRADCKELDALLRRVSGREPVMWGSAIVGYGSYHYRYDSGHEGDSCLVGFSSRRDAISLYLSGAFESRERLLAELGKHRAGVGCVYIKRLADVDARILERLVTESIADLRRRYPGPTDGVTRGARGKRSSGIGKDGV